MVNEQDVIKNYATAVQNIRRACAECNRDEKDIIIVGASKTMPLDRIQFVAQNTGIRIFGENRVQELTEKYTPDIEWHFIGQLQKNKVKYIIDKVSLIHSVDRLSLAEEINKQAGKHGKIQDFLIEVNMGDEPEKGGLAPDEVIDFAKEVTAFENMRLSGLMSVLPNADKGDNSNFYLQLNNLYATLKKTTLVNADVRYLSAGMTNDYCTAIKYGANIIRLGRAIFGER